MPATPTSLAQGHRHRLGPFPWAPTQHRMGRQGCAPWGDEDSCPSMAQCAGVQEAKGQGAAHRAEEGCSRVMAVGVLVPQHEVMRSIDDDALEVREGVEQPGAQAE